MCSWWMPPAEHQSFLCERILKEKTERMETIYSTYENCMIAFIQIKTILCLPWGLFIDLADEKYFQDAAGIHYQNDDGTFVTSSWVEVSNLWFLFDANGICVNPTGALAPDDTDGNSQMKRGCLELSVFRHPFLSNSLITLQYAHCNFTDYFQF